MRRVGRSLGISEQLIGRHPFPGPGLAIRILGDITPEKVAVLQEVDKIYIDSLRASGLYDKVWQAGAILLPVKSVGVMGDERTYESCVALRAVTSTDGMTADWVHLPYEFLADVSNEIINKVRGVSSGGRIPPLLRLRTLRSGRIVRRICHFCGGASLRPPRSSETPSSRGASLPAVAAIRYNDSAPVSSFSDRGGIRFREAAGASFFCRHPDGARPTPCIRSRPAAPRRSRP